MKFEVITGQKIPKIGFGTWSIGGDSLPNHHRDEDSRAALRSALEIGYTLFDTAESYAAGHSEELVGEVVLGSSSPRENFFITTKVSPQHLAYNDVLESCEKSLRRLRTDYIDLYLVHWPNPLIPLEDTFRALNQLVREGKVKHLGVSNFKLNRLKKARQLSETGILTDQVPYRLPEREYAENGVLAYCQANDILLTAYSPVKFRNLNVNPVIREIAIAHQTTPHQVAIAWLISQPRVITIPRSFEPAHQRENFAAADLELTPAEIDSLNKLYTNRTGRDLK